MARRQPVVTDTDTGISGLIKTGVRLLEPRILGSGCNSLLGRHIVSISSVNILKAGVIYHEQTTSPKSETTFLA